MPKEIFTELWETINNKKVWKGIIKNRTKPTITALTCAVQGESMIVEK